MSSGRNGGVDPPETTSSHGAVCGESGTGGQFHCAIAPVQPRPRPSVPSQVRSNFWLIGGTSESREVARVLSQAGIPWVATVTTARATQLYAGLLYAGLPSVVVGKLTPEALPEFLHIYGIAGIIDASHPFAVAVSNLAIATGLPYLRFERPPVPLEPFVQVVPALEAVLQPEMLRDRRVLLATGVKTLHHFRPWLCQADLWAPGAACGNLSATGDRGGLSTGTHYLQQLPTTFEREYHLWQRLGVDTVITKASGEAGGMGLKQAVAKALGTRLVAIARPQILYPSCTSTLSEVVTFCSCVGTGLP
ncbi:MAG: precorrin-6A reductase [Coleofasciculaceae cyanobacterium SM2_3_26]|nr:precorrin-6A reductase [Coleofasciculaceae cyanobacterium SM2_3_26]